MSQYPYQPPYAGPMMPPGQDPMAPARRAGWLMIVMGVLSLMCGLITGAVASMIDQVLPQLPPQQVEMFQQVSSSLGMSLSQLVMLEALFVGIPGLLLLVGGILAIGARRGGIIAAMVIVCLVLAMLAWGWVGMLVRPATATPAGMLLLLICTALPVLALVWLIQGLRATRQVGDAQAQYQAAYQVYLQQQQAYQQWAYSQQVRPPAPQQQAPPPPPTDPGQQPQPPQAPPPQ